MTRRRIPGWSAAALAALLAAPLTLLAAPASAEQPTIKIGVTISETGQGAALGVPQKNTLELEQTEIGGAKIQVIVLDDGGDATRATTNARRLVTEDKVDLLVGSSVTPATIAVANVADEAATPLFALSPLALKPGHDKWIFVMPQPVPLMAKGVFADMEARKIKTVALIGFSDAWGDLWAKAFAAMGAASGLKLVADERYARADTSVAGQALKIVAARPDAVLVAGSGSAAALPAIALRERGYTGPIYQTHAAISRDFIRVAGKAAEGSIFTAGPVVVARQLPDGAATKAAGVAYTNAYEAKFGAGAVNQFGAHINDVYEVLKRVVPVALKTAQPGAPQFHAALHDALESERDLAASQAVYNFTPTDHYGVDDRSHVMITVKNGDWLLLHP